VMAAAACCCCRGQGRADRVHGCSDRLRRFKEDCRY
jgi:hypothetical protein